MSRGISNNPLLTNNKINTSTIKDIDVDKLAQRYDGKLLLEEEYDLPKDIFLKLIENSMLSPVIPIRKYLLSYLCSRCFNKKNQYFSKINCARCLKEHIYCRHCIQMGRVMTCTPLYEWTADSFTWSQHENPCTWQGKLTYVQQEAASRMLKATEKNKTILTWAVTGSGKTEMLFPSISAALEMGKRVCIASPRADVVRELLPRLRQAFITVPIQGLYGGSRDKDGTAQLIVATTHQLLRFKHAFDLLIIDEVDAFPFHQDDTLQLAAKRAKKPHASLIYLTATPRKHHRKQMMKKQLEFVFVPLRYHQHLLPIPHFQYCKPLLKTLPKNALPHQFTRWLSTRKVPTRQLIIFVPTVQLTHQLQKSLQLFYKETHHKNSKTIKIRSVHAEDVDREQKIDAFRSKNLDILITTTILERGVTFPAIDVAVLDAHHQVFDEAALVQISGRAGRSILDPTGEVVFFHDGKTNSMISAKEDMRRMNRRALHHHSKEGKQ